MHDVRRLGIMARTFIVISINSETLPAPVYPLALPRLADAVERAGHTALQYDILMRGRGSLPQYLKRARPDLVGVSIRNIDNADSDETCSYVDAYREIINEIRACMSAPIVLGGSGFSLFPERLMSMFDADYGVIGPGEDAVCAILDGLEGGKDLSQIPNLLAAQSNGDSNSDPINASDEIPKRFVATARHDPDIVDYYWSSGGMIGVQTKRGCPKKCSYCTYPLIDGRVLQWREPGEVVDEIEKMITDSGIRYFFFTDSIFNLRPDHETELAEEICRRSLSLSWGAFFAPCNMDEKYLETLKQSGLKHVEFGTDSLCDAMLNSYEKDFSVADVVGTASLCARMGLFSAHYLIFGGPGETPGTIRETMANARRLERCVFFPFAGVRVYPGTMLHSTALAEGRIHKDDDCIAPTFYWAPGIDGPSTWRLVDDGRDGAQKWMIPPKYEALAPLMQRMRQRGKKGPLWEYMIR